MFSWYKELHTHTHKQFAFCIVCKDVNTFLIPSWFFTYLWHLKSLHSALLKRTSKVLRIGLWLVTWDDLLFSSVIVLTYNIIIYIIIIILIHIKYWIAVICYGKISIYCTITVPLVYQFLSNLMYKSLSTFVLHTHVLFYMHLRDFS